MVETPKGLVKNKVFSSVAISCEKVCVKMAANKTNITGVRFELSDLMCMIFGGGVEVLYYDDGERSKVFR